MTASIRDYKAGDGAHCERILRALPDWFGIENALVQYVADAAARPTWFAEMGGAPVGFITLHRHFLAAAEIHCIAVLPEHHRAGIGKLLVAHTEMLLAAEGVQYLQVKTLGPSRPDPNYEKTRRFYESLGFVPLEEFKTLWPGNPALQLVKKL